MSEDWFAEQDTPRSSGLGQGSDDEQQPQLEQTQQFEEQQQQPQPSRMTTTTLPRDVAGLAGTVEAARLLTTMPTGVRMESHLVCPNCSYCGPMQSRMVPVQQAYPVYQPAPPPVPAQVYAGQDQVQRQAADPAPEAAPGSQQQQQFRFSPTMVPVSAAVAVPMQTQPPPQQQNPPLQRQQLSHMVTGWNVNSPTSSSATMVSAMSLRSTGGSPPSSATSSAVLMMPSVQEQGSQPHNGQSIHLLSLDPCQWNKQIKQQRRHGLRFGLYRIRSRVYIRTPIWQIQFVSDVDLDDVPAVPIISSTLGDYATARAYPVLSNAFRCLSWEKQPASDAPGRFLVSFTIAVEARHLLFSTLWRSLRSQAYVAFSLGNGRAVTPFVQLRTSNTVADATSRRSATAPSSPGSQSGSTGGDSD